MGLQDGCQHLPVPSSHIDQRGGGGEIIGSGDRRCHPGGPFRHEIVKERAQPRGAAPDSPNS